MVICVKRGDTEEEGVKGERETISFRDLQVLDFICRFGVVNRTAVQWWAETGRSVTLDRERRLREAGLISAHPPIGRSGPLLAVTSRGLRLADRTELGPARVSVWSANHSIVCAQLAAHLERSGDEVLSERELLAEERRFGERCYSAQAATRARLAPARTYIASPSKAGSPRSTPSRWS